MKRQTFILEIDGTENQSWQGRVEWIQGKNKKGFRSAMELLRLIDSAVAEKEESDGDAEKGFRTWEKD